VDEEVITAFQHWCAEHRYYGAWGFWRRYGQEKPALSQGFAFAPATDEQLQETEDILGFRLPSHLRLLYKKLANGGLAQGPGYVALWADLAPLVHSQSVVTWPGVTRGW